MSGVLVTRDKELYLEDLVVEIPFDDDSYDEYDDYDYDDD
jgi:hypothetical protein